MPFDLNGDNLTQKSGKTFNVFNQHSKIEKLKAPYKIILKSNIEKFLKKATNGTINTADVLQHLKEIRLINDKITNNNDYKLIVNKALDDKYNVGILSEKKTKKAKQGDINERVLTILLNDLKNSDTKFTLDEIITQLLDNNIIKNKSELSHKLKRQMTQIIFRNNADWYKKQVQMYKIGKYEYHLTATSIVWWEDYQNYSSDERNIEFKSDLKAQDITIDVIADVVEKYYSTLDYPDYIQLNRHKVITLNDAKDIKDIRLFNFGDNKKYNNEYIQSPDKYINGWGNVADTEHQKKCVNLLLRGQLYQLVQRNLIPAKILSDEHINKFFNGEFTIKNIIKFFQTQLNNYGTIYIYDPTGQVLIDSYIGNKQEATATIDANINDKNITRKYARSVIAIMNGDHIDPITEQNVKKSISNGERLYVFDMPFKSDDFTFELYEHPEKLACDDLYNEYNDDGTEKNKHTDIILFQDEDNKYEGEKNNTDIILIDGQLPPPTHIFTDPITGETTIKTICRNTDVKNLLHKISNHHNMIITNPIFEGRELVGFIHPKTKQQYMKTTDFYERKKACDIMFKALGYNQLKFKNQSWFEIAKLFLELYDLGNWGALLCYHSCKQWNNYTQHYNIHQFIAQSDNDDVFKCAHKKQGTDNITTFDIIKSYSSVLLHSENVWLLPSPYDVFEDFDINNNEHTKIPYGEYILYTGSYGDKLSMIKWNVNYYSYSTIRELLKREYIKFKDIKYIRKVLKVLPANYFNNFVKSTYNTFDESTSKRIINTLIGGLNQLTNKKKHATYTDNQEVAIALNNKYLESGYVSHLVPSLYDELYFISFQTQTPNYHTGTAIWRQIQENGIWQIHNVIDSVLYNSPKAEVIAINTDSATVRFPNKLFLQKAIENTKNKPNMDILDTIGTVKVEASIKRKGHPFSYVNEARNDIITEQVKGVTIHRNNYIYEKYNIDFLEDVKRLNSCLITANGAGYGKSCLLLLLYNDDTDLILVPQHANKSSLKQEAKRLNIKLTDKNIHVMADFFNDDMTLNEQINKFWSYNKILIDEIYQCNQTDIYKLYQVKTRHNLVIIGAGDLRQIPSPNPNNDSYDLTHNTFFTNELFDNNNVVLNYLKECGRFQDDTPDLLNVLCNTHKIPDIFKNQNATLDHWKHLTLTKKKRDDINKICSNKFCKNKDDGGMLQPNDARIINIDDGYCYGVNMLLTSSGNKNMLHFDEKGNNKTFIMKNKHIYKIVDINIDSMEFDIYCVNTNALIRNVPIYKIQNFFIPVFALTIDSAQGSRITEPFSIWELDNKYFNLNRVNSAIGRTINKNLVHLDLRDTDKYFNWHTYADIIIVNPMPKNNDPLYAKTWHYEVVKNDVVIYVGLTTRTIEERLKEHWNTAQNNPRDEFHKFLINCNKADITIKTTQHPTPIKHRNKADAEKFESDHIKFYSEINTLLNTKTNIREYKKRDPIKITDIDYDNLLTIERYNEIKNATNKQIRPTIYDDVKEHKIVVYYTMNKKKHKTSFKYTLCGIDNAMKKANEHIEKLRENGTFDQDKPEQDKPEPNKPEQDKPEPDKPEQDKQEQDALKSKLINKQKEIEALIILKKQNELYRLARLIEKEQGERINSLSNQVIRKCYIHNLNAGI